MIGWWDDVKETETIYKKIVPGLFSVSDAIAIRSTIEDSWASQITQNHAFFSILGLIRTLGYNEYLVQSKHNSEGILIALDLDRTSFMKAGSFKTEELTICHVCKISEETYSWFLWLASLGDKPAAILEQALLMDSKPLSLSNIASSRISERIKTIANCFQNCRAHHPADAILPQPN